MSGKIIKPVLAFTLGCALAAGARAADRKLPGVGDLAPGFTFTGLNGKVINSTDLKGKVLLLNFFATWCGPCMAEMPRLEKEIRLPYKAAPNFLILAFGREHKAAEIKEFRRKSGFTFIMVPDPKREVYSKFAASGIPRNYLIDAEGRIIYQSEGYEAKDFDRLTAAVKKALAK